MHSTSTGCPAAGTTPRPSRRPTGAPSSSPLVRIAVDWPKELDVTEVRSPAPDRARPVHPINDFCGALRRQSQRSVTNLSALALLAVSALVARLFWRRGARAL